jgi:hypothetical protein
LASAIDLMGAGYRPQQEAIDLFGVSSVPSQIAGQGARTGAELAAQAERSGVEGMLQGEQLANYLERAALQGAMPIITGAGDAAGDYLFGEGSLFGDYEIGGIRVGDILGYLSSSGGTTQSQPIDNTGGNGSYSTQDSDGDGVYDWLDSSPYDDTRI